MAFTCINPNHTVVCFIKHGHIAPAGDTQQFKWQLKLPYSVLPRGHCRASSTTLLGYWILSGVCSGKCLKCKSPAERLPKGRWTKHLVSTADPPALYKWLPLCLTSCRAAIENTELHSFSTMAFPLYCDKRDSKIILVLPRNCSTSTKTEENNVLYGRNITCFVIIQGKLS